VEVVLLSVLGSGAAPSIEVATLTLAGAAGVPEGAPRAPVVLAVEGGAGAAPWSLVCPLRWGARSFRELLWLP
jgi:hypothetical protein